MRNIVCLFRPRRVLSFRGWGGGREEWRARGLGGSRFAGLLSIAFVPIFCLPGSGLCLIICVSRFLNRGVGIAGKGPVWT